MYVSFTLHNSHWCYNVFSLLDCVLTCLGLCRTSCVVAVARMALLLPGLSCRLIDSPLTSCTPNSAMVTFSSTTVMVLSARMESDKGDSTYRTERKRRGEAVVTLRDLKVPFKQVTQTIV